MDSEDECDVEEMIELESSSLQSIITAIMNSLKENGFMSCQIKIGDIGISASKVEKNTIIMNIGTFRIEMVDSDTTIDEKMERITKMLQQMKKMGFRPDKMVSEPGNSAPGDLYG